MGYNVELCTGALTGNGLGLQLLISNNIHVVVQNANSEDITVEICRVAPNGNGLALQLLIPKIFHVVTLNAIPRDIV